jgi:hypothetical protein
MYQTEKQKLQSQSHVATVSQSVSQSWCRAPSGTLDQILVLYSEYDGLCPLGALSLTRGCVCHLSKVSVFVIFSCLYRNIYDSLYTEKYLQYVQGLCQSKLCVADYALSYLTYAVKTASQLNCLRPDRRQV